MASSPEDEIRGLFPSLEASGFQVTSRQSYLYNCMGWAAGEDDRWWQHALTPFRVTYWPRGVPREPTVEAYRKALETVGYVLCDNPSLEPGFEKVAIFSADGQHFKHAARQLSDGRWTSKLGDIEDIEHSELDVFIGTDYGRAVVFLRRQKQMVR